jgi:hypothetical protein
MSSSLFKILSRFCNDPPGVHEQTENVRKRKSVPGVNDARNAAQNPEKDIDPEINAGYDSFENDNMLIYENGEGEMWGKTV